jgi:hypothetical protein
VAKSDLPANTQDSEQQTATESQLKSLQDFQQLLPTQIKLADEGNAAAKEFIHDFTTKLPVLAEAFYSLQAVAENAVLRNISSSDSMRRIYRVQADTMRKELAGHNPSPSENVLINRVVLDWLHAQASELMCQQYGNASGISLAQADFYQKQAERAQKRLLRSVTSLAQVRKLLGPTVQVNVAQQQVNVAGSPSLQNTKRRDTSASQ